jgi:hypothetical protein
MDTSRILKSEFYTNQWGLHSAQRAEHPFSMTLKRTWNNTGVSEQFQ